MAKDDKEEDRLMNRRGTTSGIRKLSWGMACGGRGMNDAFGGLRMLREANPFRAAWKHLDVITGEFSCFYYNTTIRV